MCLLISGARFKEAFKTATLLDGLTVLELNGVDATRFVHWGGENPEFAKYLRVWGEAGTVKTKTKTTPKLFDRGVHCMMVGYALNHAGDTYRMWDMKTNRVHETRDVIWLKRMYFEKEEEAQDVVIEPDVGVDPKEVVEIVEAGEGEEPQADEEEVVEEEVCAGNQTRSGHIVNRPTRLIEEMNANASDYQIKLSTSEKNYYEAMQGFLVLYKVNLDVLVLDWEVVSSIIPVNCMS